MFSPCQAPLDCLLLYPQSSGSSCFGCWKMKFTKNDVVSLESTSSDTLNLKFDAFVLVLACRAVRIYRICLMDTGFWTGEFRFESFWLKTMFNQCFCFFVNSKSLFWSVSLRYTCEYCHSHIVVSQPVQQNTTQIASPTALFLVRKLNRQIPMHGVFGGFWL